MVDSNDRERIGEAREELQRMLSEDELREAILLIFANKQVKIPNSYSFSFIFLHLLGFTKCNECRGNHR